MNKSAPMPLPTCETYSVDQVAKRYRISPNKVLDWIATGQLRAVNVAANPQGARPRWRVTTEAIAAFEALRSSPPAPSVRTARRGDYVRYV